MGRLRNMDKQAIEKKREMLIDEYNAKQRETEEQLDELRIKKRELENCLEDIDSFRLRAIYMLNRHQRDLFQHGAHNDLKMLGMSEEEFQQDCSKAAYELFDEQDEIERERKKILRSREDIEGEYKRAMFSLKEEERA